MNINRWITLSASALLQCSAGVSYCFSIYSDQLKDALGYNQAQIQGLASPLVALLVVGWLPGFTYDALKGYRHIGPRYVSSERPQMYTINLALPACFPDNRHALRIHRDQSCRLNSLEPQIADPESTTCAGWCCAGGCWSMSAATWGCGWWRPAMQSCPTGPW